MKNKEEGRRGKGEGGKEKREKKKEEKERRKRRGIEHVRGSVVPCHLYIVLYFSF